MVVREEVILLVRDEMDQHNIFHKLHNHLSAPLQQHLEHLELVQLLYEHGHQDRVGLFQIDDLEMKITPDFVMR